MTSIRQIEANRNNSLRSTGPKTQLGKGRSRRNAVRHGLTAETIVVALEDLEDYRAFEAAVIVDYDARTAVERELVLRLASLLWRIRRATAIETDLLQIQAEILNDRSVKCANNSETQREPQSPVYSVLQQTIGRSLLQPSDDALHNHEHAESTNDLCAPHTNPCGLPRGISRNLTNCFLRLANLDNGVFERLGRYEAALWRQIVQTLFALQTVRRR
jgi:hypothetical protein